MTSTRLPSQTAQGALPQPADTQAREPTLLRAPSIDAEWAELSRVTTGIDKFDPAAPIVGQTVDVSKMKPVSYEVPSNGVDRRASVLDALAAPTVMQLRPPMHNAEHKPRSLKDMLLRRPEEPIWVESENLPAAFAPATRVPVGGFMPYEAGTAVIGPNQDLWFLARQVVPSSIHLAHFGAAVAAATARGDNSMQTFRMLPTIQMHYEDAPPVQHSAVVLYANTGGAKIEPVVINTDSRVHVTSDGVVRAQQPMPMRYNLTYPTLESAFAKLIAAEGALAFKPYHPDHRDNNVAAIGHALTAITGTPAQVICLDGMSQAAIQAAMQDRHTAVILTFAPDRQTPVPAGTIPQAQWTTHQSARTREEIQSGRPAPEYTFLADVPYVVTQVFAESGHVELLNVLKHSQDSSWYETEAKQIHRPLAQQGGDIMRVPLALLASICGVQLFSSKIPYAVPVKVEQKFLQTPQGLVPLPPSVIRVPEDDKAHQPIRDQISAKLFEGARKAFAADPYQRDTARLLDAAHISVSDNIITLQHAETGEVIAHMARVENTFCWGADAEALRAAVANKTAQFAPLADTLTQIASHLRSQPAQDAIGEGDPTPEPTIEGPTAESSLSKALLGADVKKTAARPPAQPPVPVPSPVSPLSDATRAALRDPGVSTRFVGTDMPVALLTATQRAELQVPDMRPWYDRLLNRNADGAFGDFVVDSSNFLPEEVKSIGSLAAPVNSVHFQKLVPESIAPSRTQTSHFAAALSAVICAGDPRVQTALTMRSQVQGPAGPDGTQQHTVVYFTGAPQGPKAEAQALTATPINVTNHVLTAPDGTVRAMRTSQATDGLGRLAHEGSLLFHGYAVLENAFQKLAAYAPQYIFKPFVGPKGWDNAAAISHTLGAITGNPTQITRLAWHDHEDNSQAFWPANPQNLDAALVTFPDYEDAALSASGIIDATNFRGTPNYLIQDAQNDAVIVSNMPYGVFTVADLGGRGDPADVRVLLHNPLAVSGDPTWYQDDAPDLAEIIARQSTAPIKLEAGQEHLASNLIAVSLEALQRVGATVYTSPLRATAPKPQAIAGGAQPASAPRQADVRYDDVHLAAAQSVRDVIAHLEPSEAHAQLQAWMDKLTFTIAPGDTPRTIVQVRQGGPEGRLVGAFVRTVPEQRLMSRETEMLLPKFKQLGEHAEQLRVAIAQGAMAMNQGQVDPAIAGPQLTHLQQQHHQVMVAGAALQQQIMAGQAQGPLPQGGVRRMVDGLPGDETTLVQLMQTLFAEQQG